MKYSHPLRLALLFLIWAFGLQAVAQEEAPDPEKTTQALRALLAVADQKIPRKSTCMGDYGQVALPKISDMLSMRLAYLHEGSNDIAGYCTNGNCVLRFSHANGEDVSSTEIRFRARRGEAIAGSLQCVMTP